eukprot:11226357-Lingulodinium_polyedra.AAC.1
MTARSVEPILARVLRCRRVPTVLQALQLAAAGRDDRGVEVWGPEGWRGAVFLYFRTGPIPAVFCAARRAWRFLGFKVGIHVGALVL